MDTDQYRYFILFEDIRKKVFFSVLLVQVQVQSICSKAELVTRTHAPPKYCACTSVIKYIFFSFWSCRAGRISNVKSIWFKQCVKKQNFLKYNHKANMIFIFLCLGLPRLMFKHFSFPNGISQTIKLSCCVCVTLS